MSSFLGDFVMKEWKGRFHGISHYLMGRMLVQIGSGSVAVSVERKGYKVVQPYF